MPSPVKAIPDGYHTATPYLIIQGAAQAIEEDCAIVSADAVFRAYGVKRVW